MSKSFKDRLKRNEKQRKKNFNDTHHLINRCKYDTYRNLEIQENKVRIPRIKHELIHALHGNRDPHEIMLEDYMLNRGVFNKYARDLLDEFTSIGRGVYKQKFLK